MDSSCEIRPLPDTSWAPVSSFVCFCRWRYCCCRFPFLESVHINVAMSANQKGVCVASYTWLTVGFEEEKTHYVCFMRNHLQNKTSPKPQNTVLRKRMKGDEGNARIKCETRQHMIQAYHSTYKSRPHVCVHWGQKRGQASLGLAQYTMWWDYPFTFYNSSSPFSITCAE